MQNSLQLPSCIYLPYILLMSNNALYNYAGYNSSAPNGFVNGMGDDVEQNEDDAYPEDGPLQSGAHSLRRVPNSRSPMVVTTQFCVYTLILPFTAVYH